MQKARSHSTRELLQLEGAWFQVLFHSPRGVLFTFPSRYWFAIGRRLVFSLGGWALRIQTGFHVSRPTWDDGRRKEGFGEGAFTRYGAPFQALPLAVLSPMRRSRNPRGQAPGFGLFRFRSPLLTESIFLSSPPATEMFHFAGYRASPLWIHVEAASWRMPGCPIRISTDQRPHASPRGFSQLAASFFACRRQGIRHAPVQPGRQIRRQAAQGGRWNRPRVLDSRDGYGRAVALPRPRFTLLWKSVSFPRAPADVGRGRAASCQRVCRN